ncbi:MAG: prephenate dehydratase domain-containing protein, partial [Betaproteobacteria bacterium]
AQVILGLQGANPGPLKATNIATIWREIMSACRALEAPQRVAYLGPAGTFSELAMLKQFGTGVAGEPCASIDEVFRLAEAGTVDFAVVPVENSTEGAVSRSLDLLLQTRLRILAEVSVPVRHHLLTQSGSFEGITRVCAHAQALGQCVEWLNQHLPGIERMAVSSNAEAARLASLDATVAAIAGENAATLYGLLQAASHIQDDPQ